MGGGRDRLHEAGSVSRALSEPSADVVIDPTGESTRSSLGNQTASRNTSSRAVTRWIDAGVLVTDLVMFNLALALATAVTGDGPSGLVEIMLLDGLWVASFLAFGLHASHSLSGVDEFRRLLSACTVGLLMVVITVGPGQRAWMVVLAVAVVFFEMASRMMWRIYVARLIEAGRVGHRTIVIGHNKEAHDLAHYLQEMGGGFVPLGYVTTSMIDLSVDGLPVLGPIGELRSIVRDQEPDCIFVTPAAITTFEMEQVFRVANREGIELRISAPSPDVLLARLRLHTVGTMTTLGLQPTRLTPAQGCVKRSFDTIVALGALMIAAPLIVAIAIGIKLSSKGPVLFRQERVTKNGVTFRILKFRTMVKDGDRVLTEMGIDPSVPFFKLKDDPRLTRFGRFLRRTSLDEIPQLVNVIKGDMSLVGPRPLPTGQVERHPELLASRHEVRAGLTGWWQIKGRGEAAPEESVRLDLFYIDNWSLSLDLYILAKTAWVLIRRTGAY